MDAVHTRHNVLNQNCYCMRANSFYVNTIYCKIFMNSDFIDFVEIIWRIQLHPHAAHVMYYSHGVQAWPVYLACTVRSHRHLLELVAVSKTMPSFPWRSSLLIWQLSPKMLSINALAVSECETVIEICQVSL